MIFLQPQVDKWYFLNLGLISDIYWNLGLISDISWNLKLISNIYWNPYFLEPWID